MLKPGRFRLLLLFLLLLIVGPALAPGEGPAQLVELVLLVATIVVAVVELYAGGERRLVPVVFAASLILVRVVNQAVELRHLPAITNAIVGLFAGLVVWLAYVSMMRADRPTGDRIVGAICVYLLMGLAWASLFETLDGVRPGSLRFPDTGLAPSLVRYRYFSFVTLATLGYGDVTPVTALAGTLAALEAVTGQIYIAITIARLVALSVADHSGPAGSSKTGARGA